MSQSEWQSKWLIKKGDLNAFFGLIVDNMTQLVIMASILIGVFDFPRDIVFFYMIPGSAIGVFIEIFHANRPSCVAT